MPLEYRSDMLSTLSIPLSRRLFLALLLVRPQPTGALLLPGNHRFRTAAPASVAYTLQVPPGFAADLPIPLVLVLPEDKDATETLRRTGWDRQADRVCLLVATPETATADALTTVLQDIGNRATIDSARLFVVGSAEQASLLAAHSERIAALSLRGEVRDLPPTLSKTPLADKEAQKDVTALWRFFDRHPRFSGQPHLSRLSVNCTGLRSHNGQVMLALFNQAKGFPDNNEMAFRTATAPVTGDSVTVPFPDLPPGDYACVFVHDENGNNQFDTSLGYPLEGFGTSNNPKFRPGAPRFDDARFYLAGDLAERRIFLRATYL